MRRIEVELRHLTHTHNSLTRSFVRTNRLTKKKKLKLRIYKLILKRKMKRMSKNVRCTQHICTKACSVCVFSSIVMDTHSTSSPQTTHELRQNFYESHLHIKLLPYVSLLSGIYLMRIINVVPSTVRKNVTHSTRINESMVLPLESEKK